MSEPLVPVVYTIEEVAALMHTTEWKIYEMIKADEVPGVIRLGGGRNGIRVVKTIFNAALVEWAKAGRLRELAS